MGGGQADAGDLIEPGHQVPKRGTLHRCLPATVRENRGIATTTDPTVRRVCASRRAFPSARRLWAFGRGSPDPLAQGFRGPDAQLLGDGADRRPIRGILRPHLGDHPDRALTQLRRIVRCSTSYGSIFLSRDGASGNSGAVQRPLSDRP